jgi:2-polyprenyl-3-methyl-5-hydroxy-6-metoxy-1,4-benzoquinol methylase
MCTQGNTLEIGCGDAFGVPILAQVSKSYLGVDVDERLITDNEERFKNFPNVAFRLVNSNNRVQGKFDNVIHIDVLEHLDKTHERQFLEESIEFLDAEGIYICGTPNMEAEEYASEQSKIQHINLKNANQLKELFLEYFHWVFIFSMNDEVVHTGFHPMAHYLFAVCVGKK